MSLQVCHVLMKPTCWLVRQPINVSFKNSCKSSIAQSVHVQCFKALLHWPPDVWQCPCSLLGLTRLRIEQHDPCCGLSWARNSTS